MQKLRVKCPRVIHLINFEHENTKCHGHESQPKAWHDKYHVFRPRANYGKTLAGTKMFLINIQVTLLHSPHNNDCSIHTSKFLTTPIFERLLVRISNIMMCVASLNYGSLVRTMSVLSAPYLYQAWLLMANCIPFPPTHTRPLPIGNSRHEVPPTPLWLATVGETFGALGRLYLGDWRLGAGWSNRS